MNAAVPLLAAGPLADSLKRNRELLNQKFATAKHAGIKIDREAFLLHLATLVQPIICRVAEQFAEKVDVTTTTLYELSLELFAESLLGPGSRDTSITQAWHRLLPAIPRLVARDPRRVVANISNAVHQIGQNSDARPLEWIALMTEIGPRCDDLDAFFNAGKVAAWISGCPQYRESALQIARSLSPQILSSLFRLRESVSPEALQRSLESMSNNPWLPPSAALASLGRLLQVARRAGKFRGFGGPFLRPPIVAVLGNQLAATDGERVWTLHADVFGCVFRRSKCELPLSGKPGGPVKLSATGRVHWDDASATFPELAGWNSAAFDGQTFAVTLPSSHHVFLVARV